MAALSPAELEARLRLHALPAIGPRRMSRLLEVFGSASAALSAPASAWRSLGLPAEAAEQRRSPSTRDSAAHALAWLEQPNHHLLCLHDPDYPALLAELVDAPPLLFVKGDPALLERPQIAMVGSNANYTIQSGYCLGNTSHIIVDCFHSFDSCSKNTSMPYHVRIRKVQDNYIINILF